MEIQINEDIQFDEDQLAAIALCKDLSKRLVAISGAAGSGKTTIIRIIYDAFRAQGIRCALAAPTGKAARRIKEATGIDAVTIHRLLEYNRPGERDEKTGKALDITKPGRDRTNPLNYQVVLVDEYAMVNHELHNNLLAALPSGGCLRAFGDIHQLPPIEDYKITDKKGDLDRTPFRKLLDRPDKVELLKVYRQGEGSMILHMADKIRKGHMPAMNEDLGDFQIKLTDRPIDVLRQYVKDKLEQGIDFGKIENQIIVPTKKTWVGTNKLNTVLRQILNPRPTQTVQLDRHPWDKDTMTVGVGDKVVCTQNTYDLRDYFARFAEWTEDQVPIMSSYIPCPETKMMLNGETGIVTQIYPDGGLDIDFGDRIVEVPVTFAEYNPHKDNVYDKSPMRDIDLAFALTTHKCQGSEYQHVCYVINRSALFVQSRQNFYTAITRARKHAFVISDQKSITTSVFKVKS